MSKIILEPIATDVKDGQVMGNIFHLEKILFLNDPCTFGL